MRIGARTTFLLILPFLFALQLFVGLRLPRAHWGGLAEEGGIAFSVISIEPQRSSHTRESTSGTWGPALEEEDDKVRVERQGARGYEDENEMLTRQGTSRGVELQPWAAGEPSFTAELQRILTYISRTQMNCSRVLSPGESQPSQAPGAALPWLLCAEEWLLPATKSPCVAYSFSMDTGDAHFLRTVLGLGCEVHRFDPSDLNASGGPLHSSLDSNHGDGVVNHHKMWLEWRKHKNKKRRVLGSVSQSLTDIMEALGHHTVNFLFADLLSAEWRVFQNWMELGSLRAIHHLVVTVHLQWAGFEVGGSDEEVLRYWFSILQGLQASGLRLVNISPGEGHSVLKRTVMDARSSYALSWVNMRN